MALGLVRSFVALSTVSGLPTADAIDNRDFFAKKLGGKSGNDIQTTAFEVSSLGMNPIVYENVRKKNSSPLALTCPVDLDKNCT